MGITGRIATLLLGAGSSFHLALALPQGGPLQCATPTTTSTIKFPAIQCLREVCLPPTSTCAIGQPTGRGPLPAATLTATSDNACTAVVEIIRGFVGCGLCATCLAPPVVITVPRVLSSATGAVTVLTTVAPV